MNALQASEFPFVISEVWTRGLLILSTSKCNKSVIQRSTNQRGWPEPAAAPLVDLPGKDDPAWMGRYSLPNVGKTVARGDLKSCSNTNCSLLKFQSKPGFIYGDVQLHDTVVH